MEKIDFNTHEEYELGDTHLTYDQIAQETGIDISYVRKDDRLADVPRVIVAHAKGAPHALEYNAVVHAYVTNPAAVEPREYLLPDERKPLARKIYDHWHRMTLAKAATKVGTTRQKAKRCMDEGGLSAPVNWSHRIAKEQAYARQCKAQDLHDQGSSRADIARVLGVSEQTVRTYLRGTHERPTPIEGRTPIGEQEHDLW